MKNNKVLLIILVLLLAVSAYYLATKNNSTLKSRDGVLSDFNIDDTTTIDKIYISSSTGESVTLTKGDGFDWIVDGKHKARPECVSVLMTTFAQIAVKSPVPAAAFENVVKEIATKSVKVEIYQGEDKPNKVYYVGDATNNNQGTYMLLEKGGVKSTEPMITHIPGFYGFLTTRFFTNPLEWRDAAVFKYSVGEIKKIEVDFYDNPQESFVISQEGNMLSLFAKEDMKAIENVDTAKVQIYLSFFGKAYYENVYNKLTPQIQDSITSSQPYFHIKVTDIFGGSNEIISYKIPHKGEEVDSNGNPYEFDLDRMYGFFNNDLLVYIQYRTFDKFILPKKFFFKE